MEKAYAFVVYVDDASSLEYEDPEAENLEKAADAIMEAWLRSTANEDFEFDPEWREEWDRLEVLQYKEHGQAFVTYVPYRGENVTFVFYF